MNTQHRQQLFPRGLRQPAQGFRFSLDSLLLACYPAFKPKDRVIDLGTGCGVVAIGLLLQNPAHALQVMGLDISWTMIECCRQNSLALGLETSFSASVQDLKKIRETRRPEPESFDHVLFNPPYRPLNTGRLSPVAAKNPARFETSATLDDFILAGAYLAKNRGKITLVYLAKLLEPLVLSLDKQRLRPKRLRFIHSREDTNASLVLVQAVKNAKPGLSVDPPLILYSGSKGRRMLTRQAMDFCPFLDCNP